MAYYMINVISGGQKFDRAVQIYMEFFQAIQHLMLSLLILIQSHQWMLITILIRFQAKTDASQIMVLRDEHFKIEWRRTKFFFGYTILMCVFMISTIVVSYFFTDNELSDENRIRLYHYSIDVILLCDIAILVLLIVCGVRCACTTYHYYRYGYHKYKKIFTVIIINITVWAILVTVKDFFFFQYQNCLF